MQALLLSPAAAAEVSIENLPNYALLPASRTIKQVFSESVTARLAGNTRAEANSDNDRGAVDVNLKLEHLIVNLKRSPEVEAAFTAFIASQYDPHSVNFHKWLTPAQIGQHFGPNKQDIEQVKAWLQGKGFVINGVADSGMTIDVSGTASQVEAAFHTQIHNLQVNGVHHIANMSDPVVPAAFSGIIAGVQGLHDFKPKPLVRPRVNATPLVNRIGRQYTPGDGTYLVTPPDLATIYNIAPVLNGGNTGQGQTIYLIEDTDLYTNADWATFRSTFGLSGYTSGTLTTIHPTGTMSCADPGVNSDDGEAILDAEYASAVAPNAAIVMATCSNNPDGLYAAISNLVSGTTPPAIMSISYGECESSMGSAAVAAYDSLYQQGAAEGWSIFVSSGDQLAGVCDGDVSYVTHGIAVNGIGSSPYNVSVGGTDFYDTALGTTSTYWNPTNTPAFGSAKSYIPEIPWNNSCASTVVALYVSGSSVTYGSSGFCNTATAQSDGLHNNTGASGGPSIYNTKPSWQSGVAGIVADAKRDMPDVSMFAANGIWNHWYPFCYSDTANGGVACTGQPNTWSGAGGTSFASPIMAGVQALVNTQAGAAQGNPNPVYYTLAATEYGLSGNPSCPTSSSIAGTGTSTCVFNNVTAGDIDAPCRGTVNCYRPSGTYGVLSTSNTAYAPAYKAGIGWNFATGLGSVNVANLVNHFGSQSTVTSVSPSSGTTAGGTPVTITGTNLTNATAVMFGSTAVASFNVVSATSITTTTPAGSAGKVNVSVTTPGGTATGAGLFTYIPPAPTIGSVSPLTGSTSGGTPVTINGTNLTGATVVKFGSTAATSITVVNDSKITAVTPAGSVGGATVSVTTPGGTASQSGLFTYVAPAPTISSFSPTSGITTGGTTVTITGTNLTGATAVKFGSTAATSFTVSSATTIKAVTPAGAAGAVGVSVTTPGGTVTATGVFTYVVPAPKVTSVSPSSGRFTGGTSVTITGTNLTGATAVKFGNTAARSYTVVNGTTITAVTPANSLGTVNVSVTTASGTGTGTRLFTYTR